MLKPSPVFNVFKHSLKFAYKIINSSSFSKLVAHLNYSTIKGSILFNTLGLSYSGNAFRIPYKVLTEFSFITFECL